jgi:hypothetical protein
MLASSMFSSFAVGEEKLDTVIKDTAIYLHKEVSRPFIGSVGGEWAVLGLARSGYEVPNQYYQAYYVRLVDYVKELKGVLHKKKYTEYSRIIVALSAIGKDPRDVAGYNLLTALGDYKKTIWQGMNGPIWALIALDSGNYPMPINKEAEVQATRKMYVDRILECQLEDGGFSLFGGTSIETDVDKKSDPDITGMALQALAKYQYREDVKKVTQEALTVLSELQNANGGFSSWGTENSESCVQVIVAISELGVSLDDPRFVKNGNTLLDNLLTFYLPGNGFLHTKSGSGVNMMATEQAFYGCIAASRLEKGQNSLYRMGDAIEIGESNESEVKKGAGLESKNKVVKPSTYIYLGKTFSDIENHKSAKQIEELAARGIISGKDEAIFDPNASMTRAEFACIIIKALGIDTVKNGEFTDVPTDSWYSGYIGAAYKYGIINGKGENIFDPMGTVTKEEAATMVAKAAKLVGLENELMKGETRDILAQFDDYVQVSGWAQEPMAFCYKHEILNQSDMKINPSKAIKRYEVAVMLFNLLNISNLI